MPILRKYAAAVVVYDIVGGDAIPILGLAVSKPLSQPEHVAKTIGWRYPEATRHGWLGPVRILAFPF